MAIEVSNKAAEKFVEDFRTGGPDDFPNTAAQLDLRLQRICDEERHLTVDRIRHEILRTRNRLNQPPEKIRVIELLAILDGMTP